MTDRNHLDRRIITERRGVSRAQRTNESNADCMVVAILPPEERAAQVERVYNNVPIEQREEIGLTYAHVRAVIEALR